MTINTSTHTHDKDHIDLGAKELPAVPVEAKRYNNDPAKERSRQLLLNVIDEELLSKMPPEKIEVLCLPGIDLQEVISVYDSLGIPRGNITALEIDPGIAEHIKNQESGVRLENCSVEEFFSYSSSNRFHVVSLDYTGPMTSAQMNAITQMRRGNSANTIVFHQANSARRDRMSYELYSIGAVADIDSDSTSNQDIFDLAIEGHLNAQEYLDEMLAARESRKDLKSERSQGFSCRLLRVLQMPFSSKDVEKLVTRIGKEEIEKIVEFVLADSDITVDELIRSGDDDLLPDSESYNIWMTAVESIVIKSARNLGLSQAGIFACIYGVYSQATNKMAYETTRIERYSYISETGCPMIGDIFVMNRNDHFLSAVQPVGQSFLARKPLPLRKLQRAEKMSHDYLLRVGNIHQEVLNTERNWLGSSVRPRATKMEETEPSDTIKVDTGLEKEDAISLLKEGVPVAEILEAYPKSFTAGQLRAYKAHITMGRYEES